jgi:HrpA-like RNA helicase
MCGGNEQMDRKGKQREPNPLKVVIMSATLDAERFSRFFDQVSGSHESAARIISQPR